MEKRKTEVSGSVFTSSSISRFTGKNKGHSASDTLAFNLNQLPVLFSDVGSAIAITPTGILDSDAFCRIFNHKSIAIISFVPELNKLFAGPHTDSLARTSVAKFQSPFAARQARKHCKLRILLTRSCNRNAQYRAKSQS
ncbi:MAG: hypothetical protein AAGK17_05095 [Pseudomonadota bacterium]